MAAPENRPVRDTGSLGNPPTRQDSATDRAGCSALSAGSWHERRLTRGLASESCPQAKREPVPNQFRNLPPNSRMKPALSLLALAAALLAGCTQRFVTGYAIDPKPPRASYGDLKPAGDPQPVALVFDMHQGPNPFPEATARLGPRVARVIE